MPASFCSSRTSSVTAALASIAKWTITSEPRASVSWTSPASVRSGAGVGELGVLEVFRPDAEDHRLACEPLSAGRADSVSSPSAIRWLPATAVMPPLPRLERRLDEVHRRAADEAGDEEVQRPVVELLRRCDLLQLALAHHGDAVAHRHRLDLVVRDVDGGRAEVALELRDLGPHLHAQLRVEVRERLVHQERRRLAHDRAAHRDALALTAGERARLPVEEAFEAEDLRRLLDALVDLRPSASSSASGRRRCCRRRSGADRARSSGRPSRCRGRATGTLLTTRSPILSTPSEMSSSPATIRSAVVLPHPDGPTSTMNSPSSIARSIAFTARVPSG